MRAEQKHYVNGEMENASEETILEIIYSIVCQSALASV